MVNARNVQELQADEEQMKIVDQLEAQIPKTQLHSSEPEAAVRDKYATNLVNHHQKPRPEEARCSILSNFRHSTWLSLNAKCPPSGRMPLR